METEELHGKLKSLVEKRENNPDKHLAQAYTLGYEAGQAHQRKIDAEVLEEKRKELIKFADNPRPGLIVIEAIAAAIEKGEV